MMPAGTKTATLSPTQLAPTRVPAGLLPDQIASLDRIGLAYKSGNQSWGDHLWQEFVKQYFTSADDPRLARIIDYLSGSLRDDAQTSNVDLQNMMQKQQQAAQMMSEIAKALHDAADAVIQNIKG